MRIEQYYYVDITVQVRIVQFGSTCLKIYFENENIFTSEIGMSNCSDIFRYSSLTLANPDTNTVGLPCANWQWKTNWEEPIGPTVACSGGALGWCLATLLFSWLSVPLCVGTAGFDLFFLNIVQREPTEFLTGRTDVLKTDRHISLEISAESYQKLYLSE